MMATYDKIKMQKWAEAIAKTYWRKASERWGIAAIGAMPIIEMNARLTSTAGRAWVNMSGHAPHEVEKIDLSCYLMERNPDNFRLDTIPHELAHFIAYRVYGDKGHGQGWKYTMQELGIPNAQRCHSMETKFKAEKKAATRKRITSEV